MSHRDGRLKALYFDEHGGPEVLKYGDLPDPRPGAGEALVRVRAVALNHLDLWVRQGWPGLNLPKPHVGGSDVAGQVAGYGPSANGPAIGTRVVIDPGVVLGEDEWTNRGEESVSPHYHLLGEGLPGGCAEYVVVPARNLMPIPDGVDFPRAAAPILVGLTAWRMLVHRARLKPGESVAIVGAGGGVNSFSIQVAKYLGATVYAITSTTEKMRKAQELGADQVISYHGEDWSKTIYHLTGKRGVDVIVDNVGRATINASMRALARGGRIVIVGNTSGPKAEIDLRFIFGKQISLIGSTMGSHQDFCEVMSLVWLGKLKPVIDRLLPLSEGRAAHEVLASGQQFGKVVLTV
ncbi:MAG: zinc-binding dehydrogenase [Deltaproteobacteria bacterium]|nr:zinc-binding dehydrogenase [Deltaproteobacteria bacterium]